MFEGALFDLDGIIADTSSLHFKAWRDLALNHFDTELPPGLEERTKGVSRSDSLHVILEYLGASVSDRMFERMLQEKNEAYRNSLKTLSKQDILPGVSDFIAELQQNGVKLALASASLNGPEILERLELRSTFDAVADPGEAAHGKPAPDIFDAAAKALYLRAEKCIGIEDSSAGVRAIRASGAFCVAIGANPALREADLVILATSDLKLDTVRRAYHRSHRRADHD